MVNNLLLVAIVLMGGVGITLYYKIYREAEAVLIESSLKRQELLVGLEARSLTEFFSRREDTLRFMASLSELRSGEAELIKEILASKLETGASPVVDMVYFDAQGDVLVRASGNNDINNVSERPFFEWAQNSQNRGQILYTGIMRSRAGILKDKLTMGLLVPIWEADKFVGGLSKIVSVEKLGETVVADLQYSEGASPFVFDDTNTVVIAKFPQIVGLKTTDVIDGSPESGRAGILSLIDNMKLKSKGRLMYSFPIPGQDKPIEWVGTYDQVVLNGGEIKWSLGLSVPKSEVRAGVLPLFQDLSTFGLFVGVGLTGLIVFLTLAIRIAQRDGYVEGFADAQDRVKA